MALDGTPLGESALPFAQDLAETVGGQLRLIEVLQHRGLTGVDDTVKPLRATPRRQTSWREKSAGYLEAIGNLVEGEALSVETELCFGNIAQEVCAVTNESAAAAVVMASSHGRTGLVRTILGSVTGRVVRHSSAPGCVSWSAGTPRVREVTRYAPDFVV